MVRFQLELAEDQLGQEQGQLVQGLDQARASDPVQGQRSGNISLTFCKVLDISRSREDSKKLDTAMTATVKRR